MALSRITNPFLGTSGYRSVTDFTATAGQTSFTVPSYAVGYIDVYRNGVKLAAADFTATSGTTVVLANPATLGDVITAISTYMGTATNLSVTGGTINGQLVVNSATGVNPFITQVNSTEVLRIDSSGNVGIGTTSPNAKLNVVASSGSIGFRMDGGLAIFYPSYATANQGLQVDTTNLASGSNALFVNMPTGWTGNIISANLNGVQQFSVSQAGNGYYLGNLLVGRASNLGTSRFVVEADTTSINPMTVSNSRSTAATDYSILFYRNGSLVGSVQTTLAGVTSYVTSSDYRLKQNILPMTGALTKVMQLKPVTYKWKSDNSDGQGFIAHELQEVIPEAVCGEKDELDAEGNPKHQGVDTSFLVATLTSAIQEQQAIITQLQADVAALKDKS